MYSNSGNHALFFFLLNLPAAFGTVDEFNHLDCLKPQKFCVILMSKINANWSINFYIMKRCEKLQEEEHKTDQAFTLQPHINNLN